MQPFIACVLVGRPGLDPGTLGLKVLVKSLRRVALSRTLSQNGWSKGWHDDSAATS
jgi:hypothetical protein